MPGTTLSFPLALMATLEVSEEVAGPLLSFRVNTSLTVCLSEPGVDSVAIHRGRPEPRMAQVG